MGSIDVSGNLPIVWRQSSDQTRYEAARVGRVFNLRRPSRKPVAIVEAEHEDHIVETVRLAKELGCRVSIRSGGHSWAAWSVRDTAILLDLGNFKHIELDEKAGIVSCSPSTTGRMINGLLSQHGYMFPGGHCPDVGLGGFLLQGGMGWNCKNWGWACENIVALDVVTADGKKIRVDEQQNSDLLFAAKGAGPGFPAIITRFYLKVRKLYTGMMNSVFIYPISKYDEVMKWMIDIAPSFDSDTEIVACASTIPQFGQTCISCPFVTFKDTHEEARSALEPANRTRPEGFLHEIVNEPTSLPQQYKAQGDANPEGHRYCAENAYIKNDVDVVAAMKAGFTTLPHPKAFSIWFAMNPTSRRPLSDMALSMHTDHYFAMYTVWEDEKDDERCQTWNKNIMKDLVPYTEGAYMGDSDFQIRQTKYWSDEKAQKLMSIRRLWNPDERICGWLGPGDKIGSEGLENEPKWCVDV